MDNQESVRLSSSCKTMYSQPLHVPHRSKRITHGFSYRNQSLGSSHNVSHALFINTEAVDGFTSGTKNESSLSMLPQEISDRDTLIRMHLLGIDLNNIGNLNKSAFTPNLEWTICQPMHHMLNLKLRNLPLVQRKGLNSALYRRSIDDIIIYS